MEIIFSIRKWFSYQARMKKSSPGGSQTTETKKTRVGKQAFGDYDIVLSTYLYMESAQCIANAKFRPMVNFQN